MERAVRTWPGRLLARPWLLAFVPINAATSGFGVALPLLILISLHGAWVDVAVAASLFNVAVIVASMFWGYLADRYPNRRLFLLFNFVGFALLYVIIAESPSLPLLFALYTIVGLIAPAGASASNLLILEQFDEAERPNAFASFQEMSIIGSMAGLLVGWAWLVDARPLAPLLFVLAALAGVSVVAVWIGIRPSGRTLPAIHVAHHPEGLISRLHHSAAWRISFPFFPRPPILSRRGLRSFRRWVREEFHHELPLIFAASLLFNLSSNLFNISYTPYLYSLGITASSIFIVNFANNLAQSFSFPASGNLTSRVGADPVVQRSTYLRSLGYLAVAGFTFAPMATGAAYGANAIAFGVLGAAIAFYSTSSSIILFRALRGRDAGRILGVNSALGGLAAVAGALLSGLLAVVGSYRLVFLVSAGALLVSIPLWTAAQVAYAQRKGRLRAPPGPVEPLVKPVAGAETD
ncbi:MAG: MFS transporter [Thermoplasmata archaeon]|nr:MFS transporter [Thermoplasmata archaeon]